MKILRLLLILLALFSSTLPTQAAEEKQHVQISVLPESGTIEAGESFYIAIKHNITPGWHIYWRNPGDSGQAPDLKWSLPQDFTISDIEWPTPEKVITRSLTSYGYHDEVVLLQKLTAPAVLPAGTITLNLEADVLVCAEICIPEYSEHKLVLNDPALTYEDNTVLIQKTYSALPSEYVGKARFKEEDHHLALTLLHPQPINNGTAHIEILPQDWGIIDNSAEASSSFTDKGLVIRQIRGARPLKNLPDFEGLISYKDDTGKKQAFSFKASPFIPQSNVPSSNITDVTLITALLFALLGGLILNLMPCVFPVLSLKALKLCRLSDGDLRHAQHHSILYMTGILACFGFFAMMLILLQEAGEEIGWGFQLQNATFVMGLSWLFYTIALNLSGLFEINLNGGNGWMAKLASGQSHAASFFSGVLAALVATPCTAPFMGAATGFALTQSAPVTLSVFMALGLGLALPYLALAFIPALRNRLPKPGAWMDTMRKILAVPLYITALWLLWVISQQSDGITLIIAIGGMTVLTFLLWFQNQNKAWNIVLIITVIGGLYSATHFHKVPAPTATTEIVKTYHWQTYSEDKLNALLQGDQALFINMTAAWCITCKVNERVALKTKSTMALFKDKQIQLLQGDWTNRDAAITQFLGRYGRNGVPLYVYYGARDINGNRPEPVILPQLLTPAIIRKTLTEKEN